MIFIVGSQKEYFKPFSPEYQQTKLVDEASVFVFTGGADVSPELYGEHNVGSYCDGQRDLVEQTYFDQAKARGIPMIGICRGAQFLNVMNGGKMYQDVYNHGLFGTHPIKTVDGRQIEITSTHHQMMRPRGNYKLIAWTEHRSSKYMTHMGSIPPELDVDPEIVFYPETKCLCIQGHPEIMSVDSPASVYCRELVGRYLFNNNNASLGEAA